MFLLDFNYFVYLVEFKAILKNNNDNKIKWELEGRNNRYYKITNEDNKLGMIILNFTFG